MHARSLKGRDGFMRVNALWKYLQSLQLRNCVLAPKSKKTETQISSILAPRKEHMIHVAFCEILAAIHLPLYLLTRQPLPNAFLGHHKRKYTLESNEGTHKQNRFYFSFFFFTLKNNNSAHMKQNLRPPKTQTQKSDHRKKESRSSLNQPHQNDGW